MEEERYEAIEVVLKSRSDGKSWFDLIFDYITESCEGTSSDEDDCTCGLVSMGGSGGTYDQAMNWTTTVGSGLQPINLAKAIVALSTGEWDHGDVEPAVEWAKKEIAFEDYFENEEWKDEEED